MTTTETHRTHATEGSDHEAYGGPLVQVAERHYPDMEEMERWTGAEKRWWSLGPFAGEIPGLIRRIRRILDVSQRGLAALLGVSQSVVARWETGRTSPRASVLHRLLDMADVAVELNRQIEKKRDSLSGRTQINLFFENSTRTQSSFEIAGKRLGADVMNMAVASSSIKKGETLLDTAATLNAMHPDLIVVRHHAAGAVHLLARKVDCSVINAGDGAHEHPTQALLDALTIRRNKGRIEGLIVAICGDVLHSRVARSNIILLQALGARVRVIGPSTLLPRGIDRFGVEVFRDMRAGLKDADIVMMLRLQLERMNGSFVPSVREYFHFFGLDAEKLSWAKPDALVMHPGPMNRGVEIDSEVADGAQSLIREQVEMGVAVRMAVLEALARNLPNG
jgi:aspartate carbamoyltransferase catalytic subunit